MSVSRLLESTPENLFFSAQRAVRNRTSKENGRMTAFGLLLRLSQLNAVCERIGAGRDRRIMDEIAGSLKRLCQQDEELFLLRSRQLAIVHLGNLGSCTNLLERISRMFRTIAFEGHYLQLFAGATELKEEEAAEQWILEMEMASRLAETEITPFEFYSEKMDMDSRKLYALESDLFKATERKQWEVYYQPKVSLRDNRVVGAEALIRWNRQGETVPPDLFIPLAEKLGLIQHIGMAVLEETFEFMSRLTLPNGSFPPIVMAVNLSPYQLMEVDFAQSVLHAAAKHKINSRHVRFEITETALIPRLDRALSAIRHLQSYGYSFSLDDFGVGYSSIQFLSRLDFKELKFDKSFVERLTHDRKNRIILNSISGMAKQIGIDVVVEGVETLEQWEIVKMINCDYYQGYFFSKPLSQEQWMDRFRDEAFH
jgi:EAL domain-containing protein (putative c-di-GMP-specific phosphodiesterase class I)